MRYMLAVAYREYRIRLTNPILPLWDVLVPVIYLVVFGASLDRLLGTHAGTDYTTFFLGGVLSMVTFSIAMNTSYAFFEDLQSGIFHELLTYPFARRDLLIGKLLFNAGFSVVGSLCCVLAGALVLGIRVSSVGLPLALLWVLIGTAAWYFLFSWTALRIRGFNAYHSTSAGLYMLLMFISNLFYPTEQLPSWIRWLAWLNPVTWQTDLIRHYSYGATTPYLGYESVALLAFLLVTYAAANHSLNGTIE